jgi:hypothetical protein
MPTPADAVQTYILAKDGNRPFLMPRPFAALAHLPAVAGLCDIKTYLKEARPILSER